MFKQIAHLVFDRYSFVTICVLLLFLTFLTDNFILSKEVYYGYFANKLPTDKLQDSIDVYRQWHWLTYVLVVAIYVIKGLLVAFSISVGLFIFFDSFELRKVIHVAFKAEYVFLIASLIKVIWFSYFKTDYTLEDIQFFYPLSAINLFNSNSLQPWQVYPLQVFNVFEVIYWIVLACLLSREVRGLDVSKSMTIIMSSYFPGLLVWISFVVFLSLFSS